MSANASATRGGVPIPSADNCASTPARVVGTPGPRFRELSDFGIGVRVQESVEVRPATGGTIGAEDAVVVACVSPALATGRVGSTGATRRGTTTDGISASPPANSRTNAAVVTPR